MVVIYLDLDVTADQGAWFETAVECAAFVSFRLSETGHRVRLRTQEFDLASPAEGDIYAILRYLALVGRRAGAEPLRSAEADRRPVHGQGSGVFVF